MRVIAGTARGTKLRSPSTTETVPITDRAKEALFQYYPFLYLVGRTDDLWYAFLPLIGLVFLLPCYAFFAFGLSRYKSTGS